jgi:hypothetical protein
VGGVHVFEAKQRVGVQAALFIAGGAIFLLLLIVQFVLMLGVKKPSTSSDIMPGMIGGLSVFGIGLIARGVFLLRGVVRVMLDDGGVRTEGFIARRAISYQQIERVERDKRSQLFGGKTHDVLVLHAAGQRQPLAIIPDTIENFEYLAAELAARTAGAQGGRVTYDPVADQQRRESRRAKKLRWTSIGFAAFTLLFGVIFCAGVREELNERRMKREGQTVEAQIDRQFMRRVTPYIAYSFADAAGQRHENEAMVKQELFDATTGPTIPVIYLPSNPSYNRLAAGGAEKSFGGAFLFLTGGGTLFLSAITVMTLLGIDIKSDGGRTRITRYGRTIREFGPKSTPTPPTLPTMPTFDESHVEEEEIKSFGDDSNVASVVAAYNTPKPPFRPKSTGLTVLGVLSLLLGVLGVIAGIVRAIFSASPRTVELQNRVMELDAPRWAHYWGIADGALAAALMLVGILLLLRKPASRSLGMIVAALQILSTLAAIVVLIARTDPGEGPESMTIIAASTGAVIFHLITIIFPAVLLVILAKRSTAEVLGGAKG